MKKMIAISLLTLIVLSGCIQRIAQIPRENYELHCRNLNDNELIAEYYRVDLELQTQLGKLARYEGGHYYLVTSPAEALGSSIGRAIVMRPIIDNIQQLRMQVSIILTIIHQRGLTLPVPIR